MEQHKILQWQKLIIRKVSDDIHVRICLVAETLLKKEFELAIVLQRILTFFSLIDSSNITAKSNRKRTKIV